MAPFFMASLRDVDVAPGGQSFNIQKANVIHGNGDGWEKREFFAGFFLWYTVHARIVRSDRGLFFVLFSTFLLLRERPSWLEMLGDRFGGWSLGGSFIV